MKSKAHYHVDNFRHVYAIALSKRTWLATSQASWPSVSEKSTNPNVFGLQIKRADYQGLVSISKCKTLLLKTLTRIINDDRGKDDSRIEPCVVRTHERRDERSGDGRDDISCRQQRGRHAAFSWRSSAREVKDEKKEREEV